MVVTFNVQDRIFIAVKVRESKDIEKGVLFYFSYLGLQKKCWKCIVTSKKVSCFTFLISVFKRNVGSASSRRKRCPVLLFLSRSSKEMLEVHRHVEKGVLFYFSYLGLQKKCWKGIVTSYVIF